MAGGYQLPRAGLDALVARFNNLQRQVDSLRSAAGILSAVIGKGGITIKDGGSIGVEDGGDILLGPGSRLVTLGDDTYVQILDDEFSIGTIGPDGDFTWPASSFRPDGFLAAKSADEYAVFRIDDATGDAVLGSSTGRVHLPYMSTGDAANTRILYDGTIQMVVSSRKYKEDIADADVDPAEVLRLKPRTWVDKGTVDRAEPGVDIARNVGFIAEELDELPSMRQFVDYVTDDDGELIPDAIQYDRLTVALLTLAKSQQEQLDSFARRLDTLENN